MNRSTDDTIVEQRSFIEICDWESFQYSGSHRKPDPPWPWFRLHNNFMESQTWFEMTKPQRADFIALLSLVSRFGNLIPKDMKWLKSHGVSSKTLPSLEQLWLIRSFSLPVNDKRIKNLRSVLSGGTPRRGEERREEEKERRDNGSPSDGSARKKGRRTPPHDFEIAPVSKQWAMTKYPNVDIDKETTKFRVWEFSEPKSDWDAAWRNWIIRAAEYSAKNANSKSTESSLSDLAAKHGLTQGAEETEERFQKRVSDASVMARYEYSAGHFQQ